MAKLESTLKNMILSLVIICVVAAGALAGVYILTKANIEAQETAKKQTAIMKVLPEGCTVAEEEVVDGLKVYKAYQGDEWVATAVETSETGFDGPQVIMVGFNAKGEVINYEVLKQTETPGLGAHIDHWFKDKKGNQSIIGLKAGSLKVKQDQGDVDAITAATISSRAFLKAINKAYAAYMDGNVEAHTGASQMNKEANEEEANVEQQNEEEDAL